MALFFVRRKKGSKWGTLLVLLLVAVTVGITLAACGGTPTLSPPNPTSAPDNSPPAVPPASSTPTGPGTIPTIPVETPTAPSETPLPIPCPTPISTSTSTITLEPWKTDRGYEAETGSLGYDSASNSILRWGTDNSEPARQKKAEKVYEWICQSGGYWGSGCPNETTLAAWLLFKEGGVLYVEDQYNMSRGIHYRFGRWGFNSWQLSAFTAFLNPKRDDVFNEIDWKWLTMPGDMSSYQQITNEIYSVPYTELDGRFLYWFGGDEMEWVGVREGDIKPLGPYIRTNRVDGSPFYFTGIPNVFRCATQGGNACHPPKE